MKGKKLLSALLGTAMVMGLMAGCGKTATEAPAQEKAEEAPAAEEAATESVAASEIPQDYKYYFSMDGGEGSYP